MPSTSWPRRCPPRWQSVFDRAAGLPSFATGPRAGAIPQPGSRRGPGPAERRDSSRHATPSRFGPPGTTASRSCANSVSSIARAARPPGSNRTRKTFRSNVAKPQAGPGARVARPACHWRRGQFCPVVRALAAMRSICHRNRPGCANCKTWTAGLACAVTAATSPASSRRSPVPPPESWIGLRIAHDDRSQHHRVRPIQTRQETNSGVHAGMGAEEATQV